MFQLWLAKKKSDLRPRTYETYVGRLNRVLLPEFHKMSLKHVHDVELLDFEAILSIVADRKKWAGKTRIEILSLLRGVFRWGHKHNWTDRDPCEGFEVPRSWRRAVLKAKDRGVALTLEQARKLLRACKRFPAHHKDQPFPRQLHFAVLVALRTGLRIKNIRELTWGHFRKDLTEIYIPDEEMKNDVALSIPVHSELQAFLRRHHYRQWVRRQQWVKRRQTPMAQARIFENATPDRGYETVLERNGLRMVTDEYTGKQKTVRFHDLRHTFASWLERTCTFAAVRRLLGHAKSSMTERYVHLSMDELREEIEKLPWLEGGKAAKTKTTETEAELL